MRDIKIGRIRNLVILIGIIVFTFEASPYVIYPVLMGDSFSRRDLTTELFKKTSFLQESEDEVDPDKEYLGSSILHPYIGFVSHPGSNRNNFGFGGPEPIVKRSAGKLNICLMGGSVAHGLYNDCGDRIISNIQKSTSFKDDKINLVLLALPGFKQPQQLMSLNYFAALGAEYDMVINLDGFNEVALPYSDNLPFDVFPSYPRHWNMLSRKRLNTVVLQYLGRQAVEQQDRLQLKRSFTESFFQYSNFGLMLWKVLDNKKSSVLYDLEGKLRTAVLNSEQDYQSTGPRVAFEDTVQYFESLAELWQNSSLQMHALESSSTLRYFHFLQPNQYVKGSKILTEQELSRAYESGPMDYKEAVQNGYPTLISKGRELIEMGVNFKDLTMLFQNEPRSVYMDKCCHFNLLGNEIIADSITEFILHQLQNRNSSDAAFIGHE